ncbi:MAG: hypothetical protein OSA83_06430 [Pseudomonadales bacterium]|jgi:hypothetical protein|nr:hypothetical protein [Pseudomonadales bacterium]|tara:strand:- start:2366 stop:2578 length:213 start_codon:yes stop_codon:yes gene_type:complete
MSDCQDCDPSCPYEPFDHRKEIPLRASLFSWVSVLMTIGWIGILIVVFELARAGDMTAVPTLEAFLKTLL